MSTTSTAADLAAHLAVRHPEIGGDDLAAIAADAVTMTAPRAYASLAGRLAPVRADDAIADEVERWLVEHGAGAFAGARERAYARPGYVDVDAAILALGRLEGWADHQVRTDAHLDAVYSASPVTEHHGVIRRLLAAFASAASRGDVRYTCTPLGAPVTTPNGVADQTTRRIRVEVESGGGVWSHRCYRMVTVLTVTEDDYGVSGWSAARGAARVTSRSLTNDEVTVFGGYAVGRMIGTLWMSNGLEREKITSWLDAPWREYALTGLASLAARADDDGASAIALAKYLADPRACRESDQRLLKAVVRSIDPDRKVWDRWIDEPTSDLGEIVSEELWAPDWYDDLDITIEIEASYALDPDREGRVRAQTWARREEWRRLLLALSESPAAEELDCWQEWHPFGDTPDSVRTHWASQEEVSHCEELLAGMGWRTSRGEYQDLGEGLVALTAQPPLGWDAEWPDAIRQDGDDVTAVLPLGPLPSASGEEE